MFFIKQAIVIGPTPPGTGVRALTFFETSSNATSPTTPFSTLFIPTSITIASFLTQSPLISSGIPTATIIISAFKHSFFRFSVYECVIVTVQFSLSRSWAIGFPFKFDLPTITAFFPLNLGSIFFINK